MSDEWPVMMLCFRVFPPCIAGEDACGARDSGAGEGCHEEETGHDAEAGESSKREEEASLVSTSTFLSECFDSTRPGFLLFSPVFRSTHFPQNMKVSHCKLHDAACLHGLHALA